jgi:phosphatidylethanolamine/phosphatidyl-N-methylethanolamine N-methyltransferase
MNQEYLEKFYSRYAPVYDLTFGWVFEKGRARAVELLDLQPGERVLELGIGTGLLLHQYPSNVHVTGIDYSAKMLEKTERRVEELRLANVSLHQMDARRMDFPDNSFDKAVGAYFLSAVPDPAVVAREISRVVRPGGSVLFLNHFRSERAWLARVEEWLLPVCMKVGFTTTLELSHVLKQAPLEVRHRENTNLFNYWKIVKCCNAKDGNSGSRPGSERARPPKSRKRGGKRRGGRRNRRRRS